MTPPDDASRFKAISLRRALGLFLVLLSAFRFWYANTHGLVFDEAYYWLWARHLAPGYYDQGPGIALAIRLGLCFGHSTGAVRLAAILDAAVTSVVAYLLASRIFRDERAGFCAGVFLNIVPLLFVGGILMTHDSPQMAAWAIALYSLARAVSIDGAARAGSQSSDDLSRTAPGWWLTAGIFAGLSIDCKFTAGLFLPCTWFFLCITPRGRRALRTPWPYAAALLALCLVVPPLYWNATHQWASVRHILNLGGAHQRKLLDTGAIGDFLAGQLVVGLLFFFTMAWASVAAWRQGRREADPGLLLAACFSWPIWLFFFLLSFHGQVEPNWPVPAYFSAVVVTPWLAIRGLRHAGRKSRRLTIYHTASITLAVAAIGATLFPSAILWLPDGHKLADGWERNDRTNEMYGWDQLAAALQAAGWSPGGPWLPAATRYQEAAQLSFALPGQPETYNLPMRRRHNQYDFWPAIPPGANVLAVVPEKDEADLRPQITVLFQRVAPYSEALLWRRPLYRRPIGRYRIYRCTGYRGGREGLMEDQW